MMLNVVHHRAGMDLDTLVRNLLEKSEDGADALQESVIRITEEIVQHGTVGIPMIVFDVLGKDDLPLNLKLAASNLLKTFIQKVGFDQLCEPDKSALKERIYPTILLCSELVRKELLIVFRHVLRSEPTTIIPSLMPSLIDGLESVEKNAQFLQSALPFIEVFGVIASLYDYNPLMMEDVPQVFAALPSIETLMSHLLSSTLAHVENIKDQKEFVSACRMLIIVLKSLYSLTLMKLHPSLREKPVFDMWLSFFVKVIQIPIVEGSLSDANGGNHPLWIAKKWVVRILHKMILRHGNPKISPPDMKPFALYFRKTHAPMLIESLLEFILFSEEPSQMNSKVVAGIFNLIGPAMHLSSCANVIIPNVQRIIFEFAFPCVCFNMEKDGKLWDSNPSEVVRRNHDPMGQFDSVPSAVDNLLQEIGRANPKIIRKAVKNLILIMENHPSSEKKYGAMMMLGSVAETLGKKRGGMVDQLERIISTYVVSELTAPEPFVRMAACLTLKRYSFITFQPELLENIISLIVTLLEDDQIAVRVEAGIALQRLMCSTSGEAVKTILKSNIQHVLDCFLRITEDSEDDELISALEHIVADAKDVLAPFAIPIVKRLSEFLQKMITMPIAENDFDKESSMAMSQISTLSAISNVLECVRTSNQTVGEILEILIPLLHSILESDIFVDMMEETLNILNFLTFSPLSLSDETWELFPLMWNVIKTHGLEEELDSFLPIIVNYIVVGKERFVAGIDGEPSFFKNILFEMISHSIERRQDGDGNIDGECEDENVHGLLWAPARLLDVLLQHCVGELDDYLESYLRMTVTLISRLQSASTRVLLYNIIASAFIYNARLTTRILAQHNILHGVLTEWKNLVPNVNRRYDQRLWVLGFVSILNFLPSCDQMDTAMLESIVHSCIQLLESLGDGARGGRLQEHVAESDMEELAGDLNDVPFLQEDILGGEEEEEDDDENIDAFELINEDELQSDDVFVSPHDEKNVDDVFCSSIQELMNTLRDAGESLQSSLSSATFSSLSALMSSHGYTDCWM
eukprot:TRINITY_DN9912_c0_g1_i13.p1 TRINITY_DN9912_c0_g1~~TRINITY_DN9912_c0_g1_i13.p1  ORF type:complete len:1033 (-),score=303.54 TRINITY_DN9912_c0_g1_i13:141-3239(-)